MLIQQAKYPWLRIRIRRNQGEIPRFKKEIDEYGIYEYHLPMAVTIDRSGRLVIPKTIRDEMNLIPGSELEIDTDGNEIRLRVAGAAPRLIRKEGILVFDGGASESDIDIADFINKERDKRSLALAGPWE